MTKQIGKRREKALKKENAYSKCLLDEIIKLSPLRKKRELG